MMSTFRRVLMLMRQYEDQHGIRYEVVVLTRPDLLHLAPLHPWCDPGWTGVLAAKEVMVAGKDMMFVMPRKSAINLLEKIEGDMTTYAAKLPGGAGTCEIFFAEQLGPAVARAHHASHGRVLPAD